MTKNRVNDASRFLPVPTRGLDLRVPISSMPGNVCPFALNFHCNSGRLKKRKPNTLWGYGANPETKIPTIVPSFTTDNVITIGDVYTEDSNGTVPVLTPAGVGSAVYCDWIRFNGVLLVTGTGTVYQLNETSLAWTAGLTFTGVDDRNPICSYRERVYVGSLTDLYYGNTGAYTAAAMAAFPLANYLSRPIAALASFNYSVGNNRDKVLVVVGRAGEVLIYSGTYPAASDWYLVNKFNLGIGELDTEHPYEAIEIEGDVLINPKFSPRIFSVRQLLSGGVANAEWELLKGQRPIWDDSIANTAYPFKGVKSIVYWPQRTAVVMQVRLYDVDSCPYLDPWINVSLPGFKDDSGHENYCFLLYFDLANQNCTMHTYPTVAEAVYNNYSTFTQLRAGQNGVYAPDMITVSATKRCCSVALFDESNTNLNDWNGTSAAGVAYSAYALFAPRADSGDIESIHNAILFSNLSSSHTLSFGVTENFDHSPASTFTSYTSSLATTTAKKDILPASGVGSGLIFQLKESSTAVNPFECYGIRLISEGGGLY